MDNHRLLNILVVCSNYTPAVIYGGPISAIHRLNQAMIKAGHRVRVYTTNANGTQDLELPQARPLVIDAVPVHYYPRWWFGRRRKPFALFFSPAMGHKLKELKKGDFDLVLIHHLYGDPARMAAQAAYRAGIPYLCYTHGLFAPFCMDLKRQKKQLYMAIVLRRILKKASGIVVCNNTETQFLQKHNINTFVKQIPWGIDLTIDKDKPSRDQLEDAFPELKNRPFVLFLGRLHPIKGLDLLLPAFAELAKDFPEWQLVLAGPDEGGYRRNLEQLVSEAGLEKRVTFTGLVTGLNKEALLSHAEFLILPSYSEGFPLVVVEALGFGKPVVITTTSNVAEVEEEKVGLVVPPTKEDLMKAMRVMIGDSTLREKCSQNSRKIAKERFSWETIVDNSLELYRRLIK
jgi:glycosyltransferase involved in cell wall biosynthesis